MDRTFQARKENFTCSVCGMRVSGSGYTNHCPNCLWSRHVDIYPGDRRAQCRGMMRPEDVRYSAQRYMITHVCVRCHARKQITASPADRFDALLELSAGADTMFGL